jgi:hypothetical protein
MRDQGCQFTGKPELLSDDEDIEGFWFLRVMTVTHQNARHRFSRGIATAITNGLAGRVKL